MFATARLKGAVEASDISAAFNEWDRLGSADSGGSLYVTVDPDEIGSLYPAAPLVKQPNPLHDWDIMFYALFAAQRSKGLESVTVTIGTYSKYRKRI
jgi:hypothetical protein